MPTTAWILLPLVGTLIGWLTNTVAVAMLFRPHEKRKLCGLRLHGLVPRRQAALARKIGEVVGTHLLEHKDLVSAFGSTDLEPVVAELVERAFEAKIVELAEIPLVGSLLTPERLAGIRAAIVESILANRQVLVDQLERALEESLDVAAIVEEKVAAFPTRRLEKIIREVAGRELRAIEVLGGVLGGLIGLVQAFVLGALA